MREIESGGGAVLSYGLLMLSVIHVVDTLGPTQSLPPVAAIPLTLSLSLSMASLRAWQGHGAVSYYKRKSPSLLQEAQTHQSGPPPLPHHSFNYTQTAGLCTEEAWETRSHTDTKWTNTRQRNLELLLFMFICRRPRQREHSVAAHLPLIQGRAGF